MHSHEVEEIEEVKIVSEDTGTIRFKYNPKIEKKGEV